MLAESLCSLQEFEGAIEAFKQALEFKPKDLKLLMKLARLCNMIHVYEVKNDLSASLSVFRPCVLAGIDGVLHKGIQMLCGGSALSVGDRRILSGAGAVSAGRSNVSKGIEDRNSAESKNSEYRHVDLLLLAHCTKLIFFRSNRLAEVYKENGDAEKFLATMENCIQAQESLMTDLKHHLRARSDIITAQRSKTARLLTKLGSYYNKHGQQEEVNPYTKQLYLAFCQAEMLNKKALATDESCIEARKNLVQILLTNGRIEEAQSGIDSIPKELTTHLESILMRASLLLQKVYPRPSE